MERQRGPPATGNTSTSASASTYGQACMQCFKVKCRCIPHPSGDGCERCFRLRKDCQPSDAARRRNAQKARPSEPDARIAQLEGKVEALLSAMQSVVGPSSSSSSSGSPTGGGDGPTPPASGTPPSGTPPSGTPPTAPAPPHSSLTSPLSPTEAAEAEESLVFFRSEMLPCFPFFSLPSTLTASQLRQDRPILFQAIVTVTTFSTQRRLPRIEELKQAVFASALINTQSNIDLLLGVLTYIAWSTDPFLGRADLLSRLMVLAISLVYDLRLFKPSRPDVQAIVAYTQGFPDNDENTGDETVHGFMERQRALLACFVLSSHISSYFRRIDALRWTPQMEDALRVIATNKSSCPPDEIFAFQVRLQLLTHRATQVREQHETDHARATSSVTGLLYLNTLRAELQGLKASLNLGVVDHAQPPNVYILAAYAHYAEIYLDQTALSMISTAADPNMLLSTSGRGGIIDGGGGGQSLPGLERLECFWRSAEGIKSWLDVFYRMPPAKCVGLPSHFWTQTIWCNAILKHMSTHPDPALDCQAVRNRVNLLSTLDWMVMKLDLVSNEAGLGFSDDLFKLLSKLLGRCRMWAEARWNMPSQQQGQDFGAQPHDAATGFDSRMPDVEDMSWMDSMDLEQDKWLEGLLGWSPDNI